MTRLDADTILGRLQLRPGTPVPGSVARRGGIDLAPLWRGLPAGALPARVAAVHTLCGAAHRLASRLAVEAALEARDAAALPADRERLRRQTARDQVQRIVLDWPRVTFDATGVDAPDAAALQDCPLWQAEPQAAFGPALDDWIAIHLLGEDAAAWQARAQSGGPAAVAEWAGRGATATARWLDAARRALQGRRRPLRPLAWPADALAAARLGEGPARHPSGRETGPWTRAAAAGATSCHAGGEAVDHAIDDPAVDEAWWRLASRLVDLVRLATPGGQESLRSAGFATGEAQGVGCVEMSRGLLVHRVRLDGRGAAARVAALRIVSPTDWNFALHGPVAHWLAASDAALAGSGAGAALVAAYDPCLGHDWPAAGPAARETARPRHQETADA